MGLRDRHLFHDCHTFFITTTCHAYLQLLNKGRCFEILAASLTFVSKKYTADVIGYVFMPNHIHLILHFQEPRLRSSLMRDFKKFTSTQIRKEIESNASDLLGRIEIRDEKSIFKVWMDRFDEVYLEDVKLLEVKLAYIHSNPLQERWNLVERPEDYLYSSARFYERSEEGPIRVVHYKEYF